MGEVIIFVQRLARKIIRQEKEGGLISDNLLSVRKVGSGASVKGLDIHRSSRFLFRIVQGKGANAWWAYGSSL